jgi:hypothetical protein
MHASAHACARHRPFCKPYARVPPVPNRSGSSVDRLEFKANMIGPKGVKAIVDAIATGPSAMRVIDLGGANGRLPKGGLLRGPRAHVLPGRVVRWV